MILHFLIKMQFGGIKLAVSTTSIAKRCHCHERSRRCYAASRAKHGGSVAQWAVSVEPIVCTTRVSFIDYGSDGNKLFYVRVFGLNELHL
jgi:hypothetical protein